VQKGTEKICTELPLVKSHSVTTTQDEQLALLDTSGIDYKKNNKFLTGALKMSQNVLCGALKGNDDYLEQMKTSHLKSLERCDKTFRLSHRQGPEGIVTFCCCWQIGVTRKDFQLNDSIHFVDQMGSSKNTCGWPYHSIAMFDSKRRVCVASDGLLVGETVEGHTRKIRKTCEMTPCRKLSDLQSTHCIWAESIRVSLCWTAYSRNVRHCKLLLD